MSELDARNASGTFPAGSATAVTSSDSTVLVGVRALYIGSGGDVAILHANDTVAVTYSGVPSGTVLPVQAKKVMATNTTASAIIAMY